MNEVCVANIGTSERRQRLLIGVGAAAVCAVVTLIFILDGAPRLWRLSLFLPWWLSALGVLQARAQTCVALAARGQRQFGGAPEALPELEAAQTKRQARRVLVQSFVVALCITLASLVP